MRESFRIESICAVLVLALAGVAIRGIWTDGRDFARMHAYLRQLQAPPPVAVPAAEPSSPEAVPSPPPAQPAMPAEAIAPTTAAAQAPLIPIAFTSPPPPAPKPAQPMRYVALSQMNHESSTWRFQITTTNGQSRIIKIGQEVDGWKLTMGSSRAVALEKNGQRIRLAKEEGAGAPAAPRSTPR